MSKSRKNIWLRLDKALSDSLAKQILILLAMLGFTLLLSFLLLSLSGADWKSFCKEKQLSWWLLPLYLLIDPNALSNIYIDTGVGGWMLAASTIIYIVGTVVFTGMVIGGITNAIGNRVEDHRNGMTHYLKAGHYVIMGIDEMVSSIIEDIFSKDKDADILVLSSHDTKKIIEKLKQTVTKKQMNQIIVNYGQKTAKEYYNEIHLETCKEIYIVGYRSRPSHDAVNIQCIDSICAYLKEHPSEKMPTRITCVFEDIETYTALMTSDIFNEVRELGIELMSYNVYTGWARQMFVTRGYKDKGDPMQSISYPSLYGDGIASDDDKFVHLVFVGISNFAVSMATEAAHLLHFPNFDEKAKRPKTRITIIDQNMEVEMPLFVTRNRHLFEVQPFSYRDLGLEPKPEPMSNKKAKGDFLDVEFEFIRGDFYSEAIQEEIQGWAMDEKKQYLSIFFALADQRNNFMMAMNLPDEVYNNAIPVFIRQDRADNFVTNLRKADDKARYANLYPFGMDDRSYCRDEVSFKRAKLINYLYDTADASSLRFTDMAVLDTMPAETLMEEADKSWKKLTMAQKWSSLYCAYHLPCLLDSLRVMRGLKPDDTSLDQDPLTEKEIQQLAKVEHNRRNVEKLLMGYRPFDDLDEVQKLDFEIVKYIPWILRMSEG